MKKIFLIIAATLMTATLVQAQQTITVKGKTKANKNITVQYRKGATQDHIESVKYQLVDELEAENQKKQNNINELQRQLNNANKTINQLNERLNANTTGQSNTNEQLAQKQKEIDDLNEQLRRLNNQLTQVQKENDRLTHELDSVKKENQRLSLNKKRQPVIGVDAGIGGVVLLGNRLNSNWGKTLSWSERASIYFGLPLTNAVPLSVEAGLGFHSLPMTAKASHYTPTYDNVADPDGDSFELQFVLDNCTEKLTVNCVDVPIRVCFEQPIKDMFSLYTKLGVTPSFILSSSLANGAYTRKGFYEKLNDIDCNVVLEDIEELGFFSNSGEGKENMTPSSKFGLDGNLALGAYVPLSQSILFNVGARFDYPILKTGTFTAKSATDNYNLLPDNFRSGLNKFDGRSLTSSLQLGLVYKLK